MAFREVFDAIWIRAPGNLTLAVLSVLLGSYVVWSVQSYRRLKHIPGPPIAAWTSWWWFFKATSAQGHLALADVNTRYGKSSTM
jgi:hypothetical protein